ncbi:MAG: DUF3147 family protein, partial [Flavobacteriaceae bacterium]
PGLTGIGSILFRDEEKFLTNLRNPIKFYNENIIPYKTELELWYLSNMSIFLYFKIIIITALIIVIVSEISKRLPLLGSLIASLPLISVLGMIWIFQETKNSQKLISHAEGTFWYVLPSLPMFLVMPWMMKKGISFYLSLGVGILLTIILYVIMTKLLSRFGLNI